MTNDFKNDDKDKSPLRNETADLKNELADSEREIRDIALQKETQNM